MTPAASVVLAHHPFVDALPAVIPMVVLVGAFAAVVLADRRRSRSAGAREQAPWDGDGGEPGGGSDGADGRA